MKKIFFLFLMILFIFGLERHASADEYQSLLDEAAAERGSVRALDLLSKAKALRPEAPAAYMASGAVSYAMEDSVKAGLEFKKALLLMKDMEERQEAIVKIDKITSRFKSEEERNLYQTAVRAINRREAAQAQAPLEKAIKLNPHNCRHYFSLGYVFIEIREMDKAIDALQRGRAINPCYKKILHELLYAYSELGDLERLKGVSADFVWYFGNSPELNQELAHALFRNELPAEAIRLLESNISNFPEYPLSYLMLGQHYFSNKNCAMALPILKKFIEKFTDDAIQKLNYAGDAGKERIKVENMLVECRK